MIWTAWNNSKHHSTGAGYGFKVDAIDRDRYFNRGWHAVTIELPSKDGFVTAEANVAKRSFWSPQCRELIGKEIGHWMLAEGYAPWPDSAPPKFDVKPSGERRFRVIRRVAS